MAAECSDAQAHSGPYYELLAQADSPEALLELIKSPGFCRSEQWNVQIQAQIQQQAKVLVHSALPDEFVRCARLEPCADIGATVERLLQRNASARVAVMPQGPLTIPYLENSGAAA